MWAQLEVRAFSMWVGAGILFAQSASLEDPAGGGPPYIGLDRRGSRDSHTRPLSLLGATEIIIGTTLQGII